MEVGPCVNNQEEEEELAVVAGLPPGFRFHPTDEEIIIHYLLKKVVDRRFAAIAVGEADLNKCEPWDLPKKAKMGEKEWFFFSQRDRKYPTGMRTNRATESGYWKATGKDKEIHKGGRNCLVGMKKTLVFYKGRAPKGDKTNWVLHEYRLEGDYHFSRAAREEWVVCRIFHKKTGIKRSPSGELATLDSFVDDLLDINEPPPLTDYHGRPTTSSTSFRTDEAELKPNISSSTLMFNNQNLQLLHPHDLEPNTMFCPQSVHPSSLFPHHTSPMASLVNYQHQNRLNSMMSSYPTNFPFKGGADQVNPAGLVSPVVSHSQDTGLSTEVANDITSVHNSKEDTESMKPFDQELEGLSFSPNISDLDSLWSY